MNSRDFILAFINFLPYWPRQGYFVAWLLKNLARVPIGKGCRFSGPIYGDDLSGFIAGDNVRIGRRFAAFGDVQIGKDCLFSEGVTCNAVNHFGHLGNRRATQMGLIVIEEDCFIGTNATISTGRSQPKIVIGAHSTIGAGAVVVNDVPPRSTVVGNPGRVIKCDEVPG